MPLNHFIRNNYLKKKLFAFILLPYLLLCLTIGGFHESIFNSSHGDHSQQLASRNTDNLPIGILKDSNRHSSETCQICQWLKTPSSLIQFLSLDTHFTCICNSLVCYSNPVLPLLSIHKFTIRPPPFFSC